jgi:hypothetical protein
VLPSLTLLSHLFAAARGRISSIVSGPLFEWPKFSHVSKSPEENLSIAVKFPSVVMTLSHLKPNKRQKYFDKHGNFSLLAWVLCLWDDLIERFRLLCPTMNDAMLISRRQNKVPGFEEFGRLEDQRPGFSINI